MQIENKRIVVTGSTSGIGLQMVIALSKINETTIVAAGRRIEKVPVGDNIYPFKCDTSIPEEVDRLFDFALKKMGHIDIFVANAGFAYYEKLEKASWEHIHSIFATNVYSPIYSLTRMIELNKTKEFSVLITDSGIGKLPMPGYALYTGTKFALDGFNSAMQYEMPPNGHLTMIYPVATFTEFFDRAAKDSHMPWPYQKPNAVVEAMIQGIKNNKKRVYPYPLFPVIMYVVHVFPFILNLYHRTRQKKLFRWYNANS